MRMASEPASFRKFYGSQFLADFNLIIRCETHVAEPTDTAADTVNNCGTAPCSLGPGGSEQGLQYNTDHGLPGTPTNSKPPEAAAAAASCTAVSCFVHTFPCSGQHGESLDAGSSSTNSSGCCTPQQQAGMETLPADDSAAVPSSPVVHRNSANTLAPCTTRAAQHAALPSSTDRRGKTSSSGGSSSSYASDTSNGATDNDTSSLTIPVHGVVLAAASPYFETLLRDWKSSSNTLHMTVSEEQMSAAQVLLGFMYTSTVPSHLSQHDLLQLLLLADRFDVRRAAAAASRVLGCLSPAALEWSTLTGIWALPDHLFEAEEQAPVRVVAWDRLLQLFGDLEDTWATADGRSLWQQLPLRAVMALVASSALAVASENTVFAALASWIAHAVGVFGRQLAPQDLRLLAASVRLPGMGPCYLSYVALQHDWFRQALDITALARAAAFSAASSDVRKDLICHSETVLKQAKRDAAAGSSSSSSGSARAAAAAAAAVTAAGYQSGSRPRSCTCCNSSSTDHYSGSLAGRSSDSGVTAVLPAGPWGINSSSGRLCSWCLQQHQGLVPEQQVQLLELAQATQRPRAVSCKRTCFFQWHVDLAAIRQLYEEVAAAGSRDSRILRSPAHSFSGYEWALQLEITQTRGATGFDGSKPWALGVFLTCQVRVEVPNRQAVDAAAGSAAAAAAGVSAVQSGEAGSTNGGTAAADPQAAAAAGEYTSSGSVQGNSSSSSKAPAAAAAVQALPPPLLMQLVDFGFVSTAATISVREVGGKDKRCEKSWDHATVRYRASWGWPNYLDVQATGWDEPAFERWVIDGQMHLQASVRVLG